MAYLARIASRAEEGSKNSWPSWKMTPEILRDICAERNMWSQPHLNTQLFLNYKGFDAIDCLEDYTAVRSLHLGNNNIARIEGLDRMSDLRSLYLEGNRLTCIENLHANLELRQLNLESNGIRCVECLAHLVKLEHLNLAKNCIEQLEDLEGLRSIPSLANIDVSHNRLDANEGVVEFWAGLTSPVKMLRYHGNPGVRGIEHYRKRLVNALPGLTYLDERPVFPVERRSCAAWAEGGMEAMHRAKREFHGERHRAETAVDPERRELLTRMRKAAIARIEREAKEREELEEQQRLGRAARPTSRGPTLLDSKTGPPAAAPEGSMNAQELDRPAFSFAPPARADSRGPASDKDRGVSSFISSRSNCAGDLSEQLLNRQFAVLGDDPWVNTAGADPALRKCCEKEFGRGTTSKALTAEPEVIPELWERLGSASRAAEMQALEQNLRNMHAASATAEPGTVPVALDGASELATLD